MSQPLELGLDTFGDVTIDTTGKALHHAEVLRNIVAEAELADQVSLSFFGVGEHHRDDFAVSAPEVVLAAIASRTKNIHLGSAVTVLSSDDPVRVFQRFSTLDALSNGRAEVIIGRGSFTESFPLFGLDLNQYELLFNERLELFAEILKEGSITWSGKTRGAMKDQRVYPPTASGHLRTWIGVGGTPASVARAAHYGFPLMLAIIGGDPLGFVPYAEYYRNALKELGREQLPIGAHSPGHIAATDQQAKEELWPHFQAMHSRIGRERGWPALTPQAFEQMAGPNGALCVGSPETVAAKIIRTTKALGLSRFDLKYSAGTLPHAQLMKSIELYGTHVVPLVRAQLN